MTRTWLVVVAVAIAPSFGCDSIQEALKRPTNGSGKGSDPPTGPDSKSKDNPPTDQKETPPLAPPALQNRGGGPFGQYAPRDDALKGEVFTISDRTSQLPNFENMGDPDRKVYLRTVNIPGIDLVAGPEAGSTNRPPIEERTEWFAVRYTGKFNVKTEQTYAFRLTSDDGSKLLIDDQVVVDNDGTHGLQNAYGKTRLSVGTHRLELQYFQTGASVALQLFASIGGGQESLFAPGFSQ
jgi:hypothetical protein